MKRDARLRGLSSEHHQALVLARMLVEHERTWALVDGVLLGRRFDAELEPHFRIEDDVLLPALRLAGALQLVDRTAEDHAFLRRQVELARTGNEGAERAFATRLGDHVRFEERELFPACEALLPSGVLDEVARRSPHQR